EKKKPGTMARVFMTHPMVGDRIDKVNALIARFPERGEYTMNTSEFQVVKSRLVAFTNARATGGRGGSGPTEDKRPTLKRRQPAPPEGADPTATGGDQDQKAPAERPSLRRKEGEAPKPDSKTDSSSKPKSSSKPIKNCLSLSLINSPARVSKRSRQRATACLRARYCLVYTRPAEQAARDAGSNINAKPD